MIITPVQKSSTRIFTTLGRNLTKENSFVCTKQTTWTQSKHAVPTQEKQPVAKPVNKPLGNPAAVPAKVPTKAKVQEPAAQVGDQMGAVPKEDPAQV